MNLDPSRRLGRRLARGLASVLLLAALGYGAALAALYVRQEALLFHPEPLAADFQFRFDPAQAYREVRVPVPGGEIHALHFRQPAPRGLVFFLHGNAGNLESWTENVDYYRRINYDLFILDYRGFGKSTGTIDSEAQLHADVRAAWDTVAPDYAGRPIIVYGRSLGTGLAARLARAVQPDLLVLVSPYTSLAALALERYPFVPRALLKYPMETDALISEVRSPILIAHGLADTLIPPGHGRALAARARSPVELLEVPGAGHGDIHRFPAYLEGLAQRVGALGQPAALARSAAGG